VVSLLLLVGALFCAGSSASAKPYLLSSGCSQNCAPRPGRTAPAAASTLFDRAIALTAVGRDEESASILQTVLHAPDTGLVWRARKLLMLNERSRFHYRNALAAISTDRGRRDAGFENDARLLDALVETPPEQLVSGRELNLRDFRLTAVIGTRRVVSLVDTGASLCAISRSAARAAGLRVHPVGYRIRAAQGEEVRGDVAVGDLSFDGIRIRNVVFLVLPDAAFEHSGISALIGLPVLRQLVLILGGPRRDADGMKIPIVFSGGVPSVRIALEGIPMQCEMDTGSNRSWFIASRLPIRAFKRADRPAGRVVVTGIGGGPDTLNGLQFNARVALGSRDATIPRAFAVSNDRSNGTTARCTLGRDAILRLAPIRLDFSSMRVVIQ
jgi:predicted aspartyl protease